MAWTERYVRSDAPGGGDGTTDSNAGGTASFTLAEAITDAATPHTGYRYNVKAGTYSNTSTSRTFAAVATTTGPIWWRGYTSTIGDADAKTTGHGTFAAGTVTPAITFTTGQFVVSGVHQIFSNMDIQGAITTAAQVSVTAATTRFDRVRIQNTNAGANSRALTFTAFSSYTRCYFNATTTAGYVAGGNSEGIFFGCTVDGGGDGIQLQGTNTAQAALYCLVNAAGGNGIVCTATNTKTVILAHNTIYGSTNDGIRFTGLPANVLVVNNLLSNNGGYGINNNTGTNTNNVFRIGNSFYLNTSNPENGFGDTASFAQLTESGSPFTSVGGLNFSLVSASSAAWGGGIPGPFPKYFTTTVGYPSVGAVEPNPSGSIVNGLAPPPAVRIARTCRG